MRTKNPTDAAWLAGIIEGEGSIRINSMTTRNYGALILAVTSTDCDMLDNIVAITGVGRIKHKGTPKGNRRESWVWTCASRQAASVLHGILPYCRVERCREKIIFGLAFQRQQTRDTTVNRGPTYRERQVSYFQQMKALNVRGAADQHRRGR